MSHNQKYRYIIKESDLRHLIKRIVTEEVQQATGGNVPATSNTKTNPNGNQARQQAPQQAQPVQQQPAVRQQAPAAQPQAQQQAPAAQPAQPDNLANQAKAVVAQAQNGQLDIASDVVQFAIMDLFNGTPYWNWICNIFGWDPQTGESGNYDGTGGNTSYGGGAGAAGGPVAGQQQPAYRAIKGDIDSIIVHCTATEEGKDVKAAEIAGWHKAKGWRGIGYNYVIDLDGTIEQGRPEGTVGAHSNEKGDSNLPYNYHSIGISYVGGVINSGQKYFDRKKLKWRTKWIPKDTRTPQQKQAMIRLISQLVQKYPKIKEILGHREAGANKACPCFDASAEYSRLIPNDRPMTPIRQAALQRGGGTR